MILTDCILTERLVLRPFVEGDEYDVFALMSDDYICKMAGTSTDPVPGRDKAA